MRIAAKSLFIGHSLPDQRLGFQRIHGRKPVYTSSTFAKAEHNAASLTARRTCFRAQAPGARVVASWTPFGRYFTTGERADDAASGKGSNRSQESAEPLGMNYETARSRLKSTFCKT